MALFLTFVLMASYVYDAFVLSNAGFNVGSSKFPTIGLQIVWVC